MLKTCKFPGQKIYSQGYQGQWAVPVTSWWVDRRASWRDSCSCPGPSYAELWLSNCQSSDSAASDFHAASHRTTLYHHIIITSLHAHLNHWMQIYTVYQQVSHYYSKSRKKIQSLKVPCSRYEKTCLLVTQSEHQKCKLICVTKLVCKQAAVKIWSLTKTKSQSVPSQVTERRRSLILTRHF